MKKTLSVAAVVLLTATLGACGNDSGSDASGGSGAGGGDYCSALKDTKSQFDNLDFSAFDDAKFQALQNKISDLESVAPDEVKDDWGTLSDGFDRFKSLLDDAGISFDELQDMQAGKVPPGVDMQKLQDLGAKMQTFSKDSGLETATKNIEKHAKSECNIDLNNSGTTTP